MLVNDIKIDHNYILEHATGNEIVRVLQIVKQNNPRSKHSQCGYVVTVINNQGMCLEVTPLELKLIHRRQSLSLYN